jgi:hypothetical protein
MKILLDKWSLIIYICVVKNESKYTQGSDSGKNKKGTPKECLNKPLLNLTEKCSKHFSEGTGCMSKVLKIL